ncbi:hypothetical protein PROPEN_01435 [Proteus penneri ATCC 35198]|nr:hypothetical protein PROPEN_01435 [Proteus penneri ATCC 35198]
MFEQFLSHYLLEPHYLSWLWNGFLITLLISFLDYCHRNINELRP